MFEAKYKVWFKKNIHVSSKKKKYDLKKIFMCQAKIKSMVFLIFSSHGF